MNQQKNEGPYKKRENENDEILQKQEISKKENQIINNSVSKKRGRPPKKKT